MRAFVVAALAPFALGCSITRDARPPVASIDSLRSPAASGSGEPSLVTDATGRVWLSWLEPAADSMHALRIAALNGDTWSATRDVVRAHDLVVNWADFPGLAASANGRLAAYWLAKADSGKYAYGIRAAFSLDAGATWTTPTRVDEGQPAGRVDVELDGASRAIVSWIERVGVSPPPAVPAPRDAGGSAEVRLRAIGREGSRGAALTVATSDGARASGFPRMARSGTHLIIAWTEPGPPSRVRIARATLPAQ